MPLTKYAWAARERFHNRTDELASMERWWTGQDRQPINLYGRRRVGKSWLFRRFAHGKQAVLLVADRVTSGQQLTRLAQQLEPHLGVRPQLDDVADLFRVLYRLSQRQKTLIVIDEFPYLLGSTAPEQQKNLSAIQAVIEQERDASKIKLILTGSTISVMEGLQAERSPLHGRLTPMRLRPLPFAAATQLMLPSDPVGQLTLYSVSGGMPRYISTLREDELQDAITRHIVDPAGQLFNEPLTLLQAELREPTVYFSILAALAVRPRQSSDIAGDLRMEARELTGYLNTLESLQLISRHLPVGADAKSRNTQWRSDDDFIRFWFRFVQPYQADLEAGADPAGHVRLEVMPNLADHTALTFERAVMDSMRARYAGQALNFGSWWGPALNSLRVRKERFSEEVDAVALHRRRVVAVAEAKWTNKPLSADVLTDLRDFKLPAMSQAGLTAGDPEIVLASRSGFTPGLRDLAAESSKVVLLDAATLLDELTRL